MRDATPSVVQIDALAVQHPVQVVVRRQQQLGGVGERRVAGEPLRIGVAVRADDRQIADLAHTGAAQSRAPSGPPETIDLRADVRGLLMRTDRVQCCKPGMVTGVMVTAW